MVVHEYDQKVFNDPALADRGRLQERDHAGRDALHLHLDRTLPDGRRTGRCRASVEPAAVLAERDGEYHVIKRWALEFGLARRTRR